MSQAASASAGNRQAGNRQPATSGGMAPGRRTAEPGVTHHPDESRFNSAAFDAEATASPDRLLSCMAGFYDQESQARQALQQLRQAEGLLPAQAMLLSPDDASRLRFARLAHRWAKDRGDDGARPTASALLAGIGGALLVALMALVLLWMGDRELDTWQAVLLLASVGLGGLLGAGLLAMSLQFRRPHRFDSKVRAQLGEQRWALVAYRVPWAQQAGVVKLLRSTSQGWCAEAPHIRRL